MHTKPVVSILMGSDSDLDVMNEAAKALELFDIPYEIDVSSAHRSPARTSEFSRLAAARGIRVIIAGAGGAAHLAGVIAAETILPVIAVPIPATSLGGLDALLAMVQMPAGILAAQILATSDSGLTAKLVAYKEKLAHGVEEKSRKLQQSRIK